jgi:hypothetical protein
VKGPAVYRSRRPLASVVLSLGMVATLAGPATADAADQGPSMIGRWSAPFAEPTINGQRTDEVCVEEAQDGDDHDGRRLTCKPTATSLAVLGGDDVVYWNGLEDTEEIEQGIALEYGEVSIADQVRRLDLARREWEPSTPDDAQVRESDGPNELLPGLASRETYNDDVLFCAALTFNHDGQVITAGGTTYYAEPDGPSKYGVAELEGSRQTLRYDPATNAWTQLGDMHWGRWYPSLVTLADGDMFVASGVGKLIKPVYTDRAPQDSGRNVVQTETLDVDAGTWTENPDRADRSLPLYPRLHLLPNGDVYYNAAGQVFNPSGQAYDEGLWNLAGAYDPATQAWTELGVPGVGTPAPGFRGSTFSIMLPLRPDDAGDYTEASFLTAGGILGTTPGTYLAVADARIDTVDTTDMTLDSEATGALQQPRWYGTGVLLPTGEVLAVNGASADEVLGPGTAIPVTRPELWDPDTGEWTVLAEASEARTYHNSAALLPDGRVLVGGHDPISTLYGSNRTLVPGVTTPAETRNPTFEIFEPPYLHRGDRPVVKQAPAEIGHGRTFKVVVDDPGAVDRVMLIRRTAITHLVDGGQRAVELPVVARNGRTLTVEAPPHGGVAPAGPYLLFANATSDDGPVPSEAAEVSVVGTAVPTPATVEVAAGAGTVEESPRPGTTTPAATTPAAATPAAATTPAATSADVRAAGGVPVAAGLAYHEAEELLTALAGHGHGHDHGAVPLPPDDGHLRLTLAALALGLAVLARRRLLPGRTRSD